MDVVTLALAKKYALKMNSVGIQSGIGTPTGIEFTLKDATKVNIPIADWMSYNQIDKDKVAHLITNGSGQLVLTNDGTYKLINNPNINDNKNFVFTSSQWVRDTVDNTIYTLTLEHKLNDLNINYKIFNSEEKEETIGVQIINADTIKLTSTSSFSGRIVVNYSSSNGQRLENIAVVRSDYMFPTIIDRDNYFSVSPNSLQNGLVILVGSGVSQVVYTWSGLDSPSSYDNLLWYNSTVLLKGEKGDKGIQGIQGVEGKSAYQSAIEKQGFSGTETEWLEKLNSCLGQFSSLADLKIAYPSGADSYKFAIISTVSGQVGIAFYDKTVSNWQVTVFASTNGSSVVRDDKSIDVNSMGNMELFGFENANNNTIPIKNSSGEIGYLEIQKNNTNIFTSLASKEYVDQSILGGLSIQNDYYDASTNTPDITIVNTNGKSYAWIVLVSGTQTLGGNSITFAQYDLVIKTSTGGYLKIHNGSTSWGSIIGDISTQTDLINKLHEYAKIDDADTTSTIKTYSIKHILELEDKKRRIFMQSDSPVGMVKDDIWIDTTSIPYSISAYNSTSWVGIGSAGGTKINDWISNTEYKVGEYVIHDDLLYRCKTLNTDATFIASNWTLISGHIIRDGSNFYAKRSNLKFMGNGVSVIDDSTNDNTIITVNADVTKTGIETLTNKSLVDSSTKIIDEIDNTKIAQFEASGITTGNIRTLTIPDKDGIIALTNDIKTMTGASSTVNGQGGLVPQPLVGKQNSILKGDGTWGMSIYKGTVSIGDVGGTSGNLPVSGDIISASITTGSAVSITINHPSVSSNAIYNITTENTGNQLYANDITQTVFTRISNSQIRVYYEETSTSVQTIKLNIVIFD
jgi:hypothetical protein